VQDEKILLTEEVSDEQMKEAKHLPLLLSGILYEGGDAIRCVCLRQTSRKMGCYPIQYFEEDIGVRAHDKAHGNNLLKGS
jgi:hypothetical protein